MCLAWDVAAHSCIVSQKKAVMTDAIRFFKSSILAAAVLAASAATAAPTQLLLSENFQGVTGLNAAGTIRTLLNVTTTTPSQISGSPVASFTNTGNGNASAASFNVRRDDNAIDGTSDTANPTLGNNSFDNFFRPLQASPVIRNNFLVIGDDSGDLGGSPNGGTNTGASSTMSVLFTLQPSQWTMSDLLGVRIMFDYVFDANNVANLDDFLVELVLADNSALTVLSHSAPSVGTRGTFDQYFSSLSALPSSLRFTLVEGSGNGSSAVGIDNIKVTAVPEPATLALVGLALLGAGMAGRKRS